MIETHDNIESEIECPIKREKVRIEFAERVAVEMVCNGHDKKTARNLAFEYVRPRIDEVVTR